MMNATLRGKPYAERHLRAMVITGAMLINVFPADAIEWIDDEWVVNVPAGETLSPTAADYAEWSGREVHKRGEGRLVIADAAADTVDLIYEDGLLSFMRSLPKDVAASSESAGGWHHYASKKDGTAWTLDPFTGDGKVSIGHTSGNCASVSSRKEPIAVKGRMRLGGKIKLCKEGSGSWGFALVLHNDPRGYSARADCKENTNLGYAGDNAIQNSFAIGFVNFHHEDFDHSYYVGRNGTSWAQAKTDPAIDFNTYDGTGLVDRVFDLTLESDSRAKTVKLTLVQDQDGTDVTFTRTFEDTDLTEICGNDTAYLAFTTDAGGRSTVATVENLKVEYYLYPDDAARPFLNSLRVETPDPQIEFDLPGGGLTNKLAQTISVTAPDARIKLVNLGVDGQTISFGAMTTTGDVGLSGLLPDDVAVDDDEANARWYYACYKSDGTKDDDHTPYAGEAGVYIGSPGGGRSALTARKTPIGLAGRLKISGEVKFLKEGSGSWGFAIVLHNDPRGYSAKADCKENTNLGYAGDNAIQNSFAIGFVNFHHEDFDHSYYVGTNGTWLAHDKTDPAIDFNTYDGTGLVDRVFDLTLESDSRAKTVKLTLVQDQDGTDVTFTRTFEDTDLTEICGNDTAYLAFTTDAGGRSTVATIENLKVEYMQEHRPVILTQGTITMPEKSNIALDAADMMFDFNWKFSQTASVTLTRGAKIAVAGNVSTRLRRVTVDGATLRTGVWTAANCDWVIGTGSVILGGSGMMMIFR